MPDVRAAISLSRIARQALPRREATMLRAASTIAAAITTDTR